MTTPDPNTTYKVVRLTTEGWTLADDSAVNLTKQQCDEFLRNQVDYEGVPPHQLKAVKDN